MYETTTGPAYLRRTGAVALAAALVCAMAAMVIVPAAAQQTLVIGDDRPKGDSGGPQRPDTAGVTINNSVLDSLGSPGTFAPAPLPSTSFAAPSAIGQAPQAIPGTAYRLPGTGQLVVSRPSTLLFPPPAYPSSHLTVPVPGGRTARATTAPDVEKGQSRLLVPKPVEPTSPDVAAAVPREPVTEEPVAKVAPIPEPEPAPMAEPTLPPTAPVTPKTEPIAPAEPAAVVALPPEPEPAPEEPAAPSLTSELQSAPPPEPAATPAPSVATTEPKLEPKPEPEPEKPAQSAALTPAADPMGEIRLTFSSGSAELTGAARDRLNQMAEELRINKDARVQLLAYAKASTEGSSRARRLSLSRALAVRAYLIEKGIRSTRMDVRALGSGFEEGPPDRVDILPQTSTQ